MTDIPATSRTQKTREQIRSAAQQLFLQHGFTGTSTDAIMLRAGIASKETLYRYYASKEDLFADVLRHLTLDHSEHSSFLHTPHAPKSREELRGMLVVLAQELLTIMMQPEYLAFVRMLIADLPRFPHLGQLFRATVPERAMDFLSALLTQARQQGVVSTFDTDAVVRMLIGALLTYALFNGLFQPEHEPSLPESSRIDAIVEMVMRTMT